LHCAGFSDDAVFNRVARITSFDYGIMNQLVFRLWDETRLFLMHGLRDPNGLAYQMGPVIRGSLRDDAVEIRREL